MFWKILSRVSLPAAELALTMLSKRLSKTRIKKPTQLPLVRKRRRRSGWRNLRLVLVLSGVFLWWLSRRRQDEEESARQERRETIADITPPPAQQISPGVEAQAPPKEIPAVSESAPEAAGAPPEALSHMPASDRQAGAIPPAPGTTAAEQTTVEPVPPEAETTLYEQGAPATQAPPPAERSAVEPIPPEAESELLTGAAPAAEPDDLTVIEGIGPKISSVLQAAGITTYAQLAETDQNRLEEILRDSNLRLANPTTWGEQAGLAAAGDWDGLMELQTQLKGGRRQ